MTAAAAPSIGRPLTRVDGPVKVGRCALCAAEFFPVKLAYGALIQSPAANGRLTNLDFSAAKAAPGVIDILTRENAPHFRPYPEIGARGTSEIGIVGARQRWQMQFFTPPGSACASFRLPRTN